MGRTRNADDAPTTVKNTRRSHGVAAHAARSFACSLPTTVAMQATQRSEQDRASGKGSPHVESVLLLPRANAPQRKNLASMPPQSAPAKPAKRGHRLPAKPSHSQNGARLVCCNRAPRFEMEAWKLRDPNEQQ